MAKTAAVKIEVRWREQGTDQWSDIQSVPVTSKIVVEGLDRTKTYEFEYRGVSACGARSAWGSTAHAIPDVGPGNIVLADVKAQADNAAADALAANQELANIASDNVLSQGEKPTVIRDVNVITAEQAGIDTQASAFSITTEKTAYDNAVSALTTYLATLTTPTLWSDLSGDTTIVGTTFRSKFQDVYTNRQTLLNKVASVAATQATWSGVSGTGKPQDNATVGGTLGPGGNVNGAVDGNGRAVIDFSQGGHFNKNLDNIGDGTGYYRIPAGNLDANRRALIDFSQGGHNYKTLDYIGDGGSYGRTLLSRLSSGNPLIDFAAGYHLNKNVDNLADGSTYARPKASRLQNGIPILPSYGRNLAPNELMANNTAGVALNTALSAGAAACDGWKVYSLAGGVTMFYSNSAGFNSATSLTFQLGNGSVIPSGTYYPSFTMADFIPAREGDRFIVGAHFFWNSNYAIPAGVTLRPEFGIFFYDGSGAYLGSILCGPGANVQGFNNTGTGSSPVTATGSAPAGTAKALIGYQLTIYNSNGSSVVIPSGNNFPAIIYCNGVSVYQQSNIDNDVVDGSTYGRTVQSRLSSGVPFIDFAAGIHLNKNIDNVADGTTFARVSTSALTGGNIDFAKSGFANKTVDNVGDGTTYARIKGTELSSGVHKLGVAGSGAVLGNQLNIPNSLTLNYGAVRSATALTASSTGAVSVNAFTYYMGAASPSYSAVSNAVTGLTQGVTYYIYTRDAGGLGGTKAWSATTNINALLQTYDDIVVAGQVKIPTSGSSGGGGSGSCVCDSMLIDHGLMAADMRAGDVADCMDLPSSGLGKFRRALTGVERSLQLCVRITTDGGAVLECSESTPFDLPGGGVAYAPHMRGRKVVTDHGIEVVARVEYIGMQPVSHLHFGGCSYAAGRDAAHRIYSHNQINKP